MSASVIGRERELAAVEPFLDNVLERFGVLLFSGPAGIDKTTLWEHAVTAARSRGYRVVLARPTEVETALAFAALNDLLGELADDETLADLPEPQRAALDAALLRVPATSPSEPLAVSIAALTVYDMVKSADKTMVIDNIRLMEKKGGRSGHYVRKV